MKLRSLMIEKTKGSGVNGINLSLVFLIVQGLFQQRAKTIHQVVIAHCPFEGQAA